MQRVFFDRLRMSAFLAVALLLAGGVAVLVPDGVPDPAVPERQASPPDVLGSPRFEAEGDAFVWQGGVPFSVGPDGLLVDGHAIRFPGATVQVVPEAPTGGRSAYLLGNDPAAWRTGIEHFERVRLPALWPGLDMVWYPGDDGLEFDLLVAPGADPDQFRISAEGLTLVAGRLRIGALLLQAPVAEQDGRNVAVSWWQRGDEAGFDVGAYDTTRALRVDPTLVYASYHSVNIMTSAQGGRHGFLDLKVGRAANDHLVWTAGMTNAVEPRLVPGGTSLNVDHHTDAFAAAFDQEGNLMFQAIFGGADFDAGTGIAIADDGGVVLVGCTVSDDFPGIAPWQAARGGGVDLFIVQLDPTAGGASFSTYVGGPGNDGCLEVEEPGVVPDQLPRIDGEDNGRLLAITAVTDAPGLPIKAGGTLGFLDSTAAGIEAWIGVIDLLPVPALTAATYWGSNGDDIPNNLDFSGGLSQVVVVGSTTSPDLQLTPGGPDCTLGTNPSLCGMPGFADGFLSVLDIPRAVVPYSTYIGTGAVDDHADAVVVRAGKAYVTGRGEVSTTPFALQALPLGPPGTIEGNWLAAYDLGTGAREWTTYLDGRVRSTAAIDQGLGEGGPAIYLSGVAMDMMGSMVLFTYANTAGTSTAFYPATGLALAQMRITATGSTAYYLFQVGSLTVEGFPTLAGRDTHLGIADQKGILMIWQMGKGAGPAVCSSGGNGNMACPMFDHTPNCAGTSTQFTEHTLWPSHLDPEDADPPAPKTLWDYGDGSERTTETNHTYAGGGTYRVTMRTYDIFGGVWFGLDEIFVCHPLPEQEGPHGLPNSGPSPGMFQDTDKDGIVDVMDDCPMVADPDQKDGDADGIGDLCEAAVVVPTPLREGPADMDRDGLADIRDNCPSIKNRGQEDLDHDEQGDVCDDDIDGDGVLQVARGAVVKLDNCAFTPNPEQDDADRDGTGDACQEVRVAMGAPREADLYVVPQTKLDREGRSTLETAGLVAAGFVGLTLVLLLVLFLVRSRKRQVVDEPR